jgi:hypothetical protein
MWLQIRREIHRKSFEMIGFIETAEADFNDFRIEFLGEFEAICETVLARVNQGPLARLIHEKTEGRK